MSHAIDLETGTCRKKPSVASSAAPVSDPDFVATLAHEIRNILAPLGNSADLLNMPGIDAAEERRAKAIIGRQVRQLRRLVNDLLDAHRLELRQTELVARPTDLVELVSGLCEDHRSLFLGRGVGLEMVATVDALWLEVDADRLDQALTNLLSNSLKFTDRGGIVRVGVTLDCLDQRAIISVRDTGVGIEPDMMKSIFRPHAHELSSRNQSGLGIGLPLAQRLVELHGGRLEAESQGRGQGAEFRIVLPLRFLDRK